MMRRPPPRGRSRRQRYTTPWALLLAVFAGCRSPSHDAPATPSRACPPVEHPAPLSLAAARAAHRHAERRQEIRLREAASPGRFLREAHERLDADQLATGGVCLTEAADLGQLVFEHEYGFSAGLGSGARSEPARRPFRRVHQGTFGGPETISCPSCHWVGGPNGAGAETDNAMLNGDGSGTDSGDARNPPALVALGVVQALAQEMSRDLQQQRANLVREAIRSGSLRAVPLIAKGVSFGTLRSSADGEVDSTGVVGVDPDLIVKPFGWKGNFSTIADISADALQVHLGIQSDHLLATSPAEATGNGGDPLDPDGDGVRRELGPGPFRAMVAHLALLELPIVEPFVQDRDMQPAATGLLAPTTTSFADDFRRGRELFHKLGCAACHLPMMVLNDPVLRVEGLPEIDLADEMRQPALRYDPQLGGYPVWLFSDLKRHDMGHENAARHRQRGVAERAYLTPRLWGVADSPPYLHDGRAPNFDYAVAGHGGEGAEARTAFTALSPHDKGGLRVYLMSLRRLPRLVVP